LFVKFYTVSNKLSSTHSATVIFSKFVPLFLGIYAISPSVVPVRQFLGTGSWYVYVKSRDHSSALAGLRPYL